VSFYNQALNSNSSLVTGMNQINQQITRAQRRMIIGQWITTLCICLFASLMVAVIAIAIPKIWHLDFLDTDGQPALWNQAWLGGAVALGLIASVVQAGCSTRN
jgi:hypothetical protein